MNQIFIKKILCTLTLFVLIILLTGCDKLKIIINTTINEDGSAYRRIEYVLTPVEEEQLKYIDDRLPDILAEGFKLPEAPDWKVNKFIEDEAFHYVAERKFASLNDLKSDYYKKSRFAGASQNFVSFNMADKSTSTNYDLLEIYRDSSDIVKFTNAFADHLEKNRKKLTEKLFKITKEYIPSFDRDDSEDIVELFINKANSFRQIVNNFHIIGPHEITIIDKELKQLNTDIKISDFMDMLADQQDVDISSPLIKRFHLTSTELSKEKKQELADKLKSFVKNELKDIAIANNADPLGAYYTNLDMLNTYSFEYTIEMPGNITNSNGNRLEENRVQWIFEPEDFFNHDYVIIVKSSVPKQD